MSDQPVRPTLDPDKLREERRDADLGATEETGHSSAGKGDAESAPLGPTTTGATPPAR